MKLFYTLLLSLAGLLISSHSIAQGSLAALDAKNGFRDAKLGMKLSQFKGMYIYKADKAGDYVRNTDKKMIGDIPLKQIKYRFHKGILYGIFITADFNYGDDLVSVLESSYGKSKEDKYKNKYWKTSQIEMRLCPTIFSEDDMDGMTIQIISISLAQKARYENMQEFVEKQNAGYDKQAAKRKADL